MYSCRQVRDEASALVDGEWPWTSTLALRMHLLLCNSCRRFVRQLRLLVSTLGARQTVARLPSSTTEKILAALPLEPSDLPFEPPRGSS
jgi:hypothetical protein